MSELLANRYRLEEVLGQGASATVYAAFDEELGVRVAVKLLHPHLEQSGAERILGEAHIAMSLHHPNIVACHGAFTSEGRHFIVFERIDGVSLASIVEAGPLPIAQIRTVLIALAAALCHAHGKGVLHRDLSPANILIVAGDEPRVTLIDFGIAKAIPEGSATQTTGVGTTAYAAPEQLTGNATTQSDLFGLGAVGFYMLTGHPPLDAVGKIRAKLPSHTPVALADLVVSCLQPESADRPSSAAEVLARLEATRGSITVRGRRALTALMLIVLVGLAVRPFLVSSTFVSRSVVGRIATAIETTSQVRFTHPALVGPMVYVAIANEDLPRLSNLLFERGQTAVLRKQLFSQGSCYAAEYGYGESLEYLIRAGADLRDACGRSPSEFVDRVVESGLHETIAFLFEHKKEFILSVEMHDPFESATRRGDLAMFIALLRGFKNLEPMPRVHSSPALWSVREAAERRRGEFEQAIIATGPSVTNMTDSRGNTALHLAVISLRPRVVHYYLGIPGVDPRRVNDFGLTPLHIAIFMPGTDQRMKKRRRMTLESFTARRVELNTPDRNGDTPLHYAIGLGAVWAVEVLLAGQNLDLNVRDRSGRTPVERALERHDPIGAEIVTLIESRKPR